MSRSQGQAGRQGGRKEALLPFTSLAFIPFLPPASRYHS